MEMFIREEQMVDGQVLKTGNKNDQGKPPIALIWPEAIEEEAAVMGLGEKKYGTWNWTNGLSVVRVASALLRHTYAFLGGEDLDPESGKSHMAHVRCCAAFIIFYMKYRRDLDDRFKGYNQAGDVRMPTTHK